MSTTHSEIGPELRQLAQTILERLDPVVRAAVAAAASRGDSPGKCQQVWCPVCAVAAMVQGEQHPLLDVIAEHSISLLTLVRAVVDGAAPAESDASAADEPAADEHTTTGGYEHIPITIDE